MQKLLNFDMEFAQKLSIFDYLKVSYCKIEMIYYIYAVGIAHVKLMEMFINQFS